MKTISRYFEGLRSKNLWVKLVINEQLTKYPDHIKQTNLRVNDCIEIFVDMMKRTLTLISLFLVLIFGCIIPQNQSAGSYFAMVLFTGFYCSRLGPKLDIWLGLKLAQA